MRSLLLAAMLGLICTACSLPAKNHQMRTEIAPASGQPQLMNIRIERWGTTRFSGLIALQERGASLYYVLLDATGLKLMEALVNGDGTYALIRAHGALKETVLPELLSESLHKIYLLEPDRRPCSRNLLLALCQKEAEKNGWRKYAALGPLTLWSVASQGATPGRNWPTSSFSQPWIGVKIILTQNNQLN
ncbi:MAG: hypothetical protein ABFR97_05780 [Thermodesulfobacteriota bacterium]